MITRRIETILSSELAFNQRLQKICQLLHDENNNYDWVGFYFHNTNNKELILGPYVGDATDHTNIPFGKGICGQVAVSNQTYVVDDVNAEENYLACSVATKSEIVVPIFVAGKNIGQLDIDSHALNRFSENDRQVLEDICAIIGRKIEQEKPNLHD